MRVTTAPWFLIIWLQATDLAGISRASSVTHGANNSSTSNLTVPHPGLTEPHRSRTGLTVPHHSRTGRSTNAEYDSPAFDDEVDIDDEDNLNSTEPGIYLGGWCKDSCSSELSHVYCDLQKGLCLCEKKFPVRLGKSRGCASPKLLGDQCFYTETCSFIVANAICAQVGHNAECACKPGYHIVNLQKGVKRAFCTEDGVVLHTDLPSLLVVAGSIAVLSGLLCFILKLFTSSRFNENGRYGDANLAPPLLFSSDNQWINGIPLTVHRPSSRTSSHRSTTNLTHYRSKGVLVPASRAGAARAAAILLIPCHLQNARTPPCPEVAAGSSREDDLESQTGSRRASISSLHSNASSYSQRRFEMENVQREQRAAMRAAREQAAKAASSVVLPTPSPISTDHLLPSCEELAEDPLGIVSSAFSASSAASLAEPATQQLFPSTSKSFQV